MAKSSSEYWESRIASSTWKTYNSLEKKNRELLDFYTDASKSIKEELYDLAEKYSKDGVLTLSEMHKQGRLENLEKKYNDIALSLGTDTENMATRNMKNGFKEVYESTAVGMGHVDFSLPDKKLMDKLLNEPWRGDSFSKRLWKNQKKMAVGLNNLLLAGLQQGKTVMEIAVNLHNFVGGAFNNAHRLVRTETMHYLNSAALQRYKDSGVTHVQAWAAIDERTCDTCGSYHSKIYSIDKCPALPFHANCRCTILPVVEDGKMALSIPDAVYKKSGMTQGTRLKINVAVKKLEREYVVYLDKIEGGIVDRNTIFAAGGFMKDGLLKYSIIFNYNIDYETVEKRMKKQYNKGTFAGKNYEDYIAHEMAHIIPYQDCITETDYYTKRELLRKDFVQGISKYADSTKDGAESLAESFVRYRNGEEIPKEALELIEKYIIPWRR